MSLHGPVVFVEDDAEDHEFIVEAYNALSLKNNLKVFSKAQEALEYLRTTTDRPFIIISEITLLGMDGLEFRKQIITDDYLRGKGIPFIFFTTNYDRADVQLAYELQVQGYFIKKYSIPETSRMLLKIMDYWVESYHPNNIP